MNENYTAQTQMQKGFRTFILTLSVSLIIFSVIYYFISDTQTVSDLNVTASEEQSSEVVVPEDATTSTNEVASSQMALATPEDIDDDSEGNTESVFGKLNAAPVTVTSRAVLAGATTSATTTAATTAVGTTAPRVTRTSTIAAVPNGGVTQLTWGFFISLVAFTLGFVVISKDPRKMAIQHFEKKMLR